MHRCLSVDEIVRVVASHGEPKDLVTMARTCHAFYEPAADEIWRSLPGLTPLLQCLPDNCYTIRRRPDGITTLMMSQEVWRRPLCLTRFLHHARRVRDLTVPNTPGCNCPRSPYVISRDWWRLLRCVFRRAGMPVLPNLRSLSWHDYDNPREIVLLLGLSLRSLEIVDFPNTSKHITKAMKVVKRRVPRLEKFTLCIQTLSIRLYSPTVLGSVRRALHSLSHLTTVHISGPLSGDTLRHLSSLPSLANLAMDVGEADYEYFPGVAEILPFTALSSLDINTPVENLNPLLSFLRAIRPAQLLEFCAYLTFRYDADGSMISLQPITQDLSALVSLLGRFGALHSCMIHTILRIPLPVQPSFPMSEDALLPLLALKHLRHLDLAHVTPTQLSPDFFSRAAKSWPSLRYLALGVYDWNATQFTVAVEDLLPLATHCRNLRTLSIPLSHSRGDESELPAPQTTLEHIYHSWVEDSQVEAVAAVLARIFPKVQVEYSKYLNVSQSADRLNALKEANIKELDVQV